MFFFFFWKLSRVGNEHCSVFGKRLFVFVVVFGVRSLNVFVIVFGCVWCLGPVLLCLVFASGVVFCSVLGLPSSQVIAYEHHI